MPKKNPTFYIMCTEWVIVITYFVYFQIESQRSTYKDHRKTWKNCWCSQEEVKLLIKAVKGLTCCNIFYPRHVDCPKFVLHLYVWIHCLHLLVCRMQKLDLKQIHLKKNISFPTSFLPGLYFFCDRKVVLFMFYLQSMGCQYIVPVYLTHLITHTYS